MWERNQFHFAILDHEDRYYRLNETQRYINFSVVHVNYTYDPETKKENKNTTYSSLVDCSKDDFDANMDQNAYYNFKVN